MGGLGLQGSFCGRNFCLTEGQVPPLNHPAPAPWRAPGIPEKGEEIEIGVSYCFSWCQVSAQRVHTFRLHVPGMVPICARVHWGDRAPPGQSSVQLSREGGMLGVHVVLHPDGPISQHITQTSRSFVMDGEAWHAAVHGVTKSWTQLSN